MSSASASNLLLNSNAVDLDCKDLHEYLRSRPPEILERLYNDPATCLAVYRELPEIARQFVMRILFVEQPVPQAVISSWCSQHFAKEQMESTAALTALNIWRATAIPGGLAAWELTLTFKKNLRYALIGEGKPWIALQPFEDSKPREISFLDNYAMSRWRCVLHYMVGAGGNVAGNSFAGVSGSSQALSGSDQNECISPDAVRILLHAKLMKRDDNASIVITRQGFQFLLLDTQSQVWHFMLQYLDTCEERGFSLVECLTMLFQLSFATLGQDYSSERLTPKMLVFLQHLREFGLVFQRKRKEGRYYPTRLAINVTNKNATVFDDKNEESGYIIVETNYRVYAYTDSQLQIAILALFTDLLYRFPNMVVGVLSRDSVRQALRGGITADQIISYLEQYSHSNMKQADSFYKSKSPLPPTIIDQIKLWEKERNRFIYTEGVVYNQFLSQADFVTLRDYAQSINVLIWQNERQRSMVVSKNGHDDVKKYWKRYSKSGT